jgi:parallel beta-helix repeat protein
MRISEFPLNSNPVFPLGLCLLFLASSCSNSSVVSANNFDEFALQEKLIAAKEGAVIELGPGEFNFSRSLSLDGIANITLKGAGADETILDFSGQTDGAEGLKITADNFTLEDLAVINASGDAVKVQNSKGLNIRRVRVAWSGGPNSNNGAYGLYPVTCEGVLIEDCNVSDASDAGIYVGQSKNIVVRRNYVHENVAGIEIENSIGADVYENNCTGNTGGILVFDLPELPFKNGNQVRVYDNNIEANNLGNFAPKGNIVGTVPAGTGVLVMATTDVEVFNNKIVDHQTFGAAVISYLMLDKPYEDAEYSPFANRVSIRDNVIQKAGQAPDQRTEFGALLAMLYPEGSPAILLDGIPHPAEELQICISSNGEAEIASIDAANNFLSPRILGSELACELPELPAIEL